MTAFGALVGHEAAIRALQRALASDCLPGTYLFVGGQGVGKMAMARAFAMSAACLEPQANPFDACGQCSSCRLFLRGTHTEIHTVSPAGDHTQIWQFWDRENRPPGLLSHTLSYAPALGRKRVYILDRADTLNESAANSLLKVLEEPPPYVLFILLAPSTARVLPTIVSRSQTVRLSGLPQQTVAGLLEARFGLESVRATTLAAYAEGRIGQAVRMAERPEIGEEMGRILDFAETLPEAGQVRALRAGEQLRKLAGQVRALLGETKEEGESSSEESGKERAGRQQVAAVFNLLVVFYRDLLTLSIDPSASDRVVNRDRVQSLMHLAQAGSPQRWVRCLDSLLLAQRWLEANANVALLTEQVMMRLLRAER